MGETTYDVVCTICDKTKRRVTVKDGDLLPSDGRCPNCGRSQCLEIFEVEAEENGRAGKTVCDHCKHYGDIENVCAGCDGTQWYEFKDQRKAVEPKPLKYDAGKPKWSLLPMRVIEQVVKVLTFGADKYSKDGWKNGEYADAKERYLSANQRHLTDYQDGEMLDKESKLPHLAHAICCLVFLLWYEMRGGDER